MCLHGINTLALIHETWVTVYCKMLTHLYVNNPIDLEMNAMIFSCVGVFFARNLFCLHITNKTQYAFYIVPVLLFSTLLHMLSI